MQVVFTAAASQTSQTLGVAHVWAAGRTNGQRMIENTNQQEALVGSIHR